MIARSAARSTVDLVGLERGELQLAGQQVALGDEHLLLVGVAVEADELHPVEQRRRDRVGDVGRGDEHDVAQVELDLQVVVAERVVLRRVEHLEQRRGGVAAPPAGAELVDLVEQDDRVHRPGLHDRPDDAARLRCRRRCGGGRGSRPRRGRRRATTRTKLRPIARATDSPTAVLPTPGGPTSVSDRAVDRAASARRPSSLVDAHGRGAACARRGTRRCGP